MLNSERRMFNIEPGARGEAYADSLEERLRRIGYHVKRSDTASGIIITATYTFDMFFRDTFKGVSA